MHSQSTERCAECAASHKPDQPCASPMGAVRTPFPTLAETIAWENFLADLPRGNHPAGECDGCGNDAVELLVHREADPFPCTLRYCRPCASDDWWYAPGAEIIVGEAI